MTQAGINAAPLPVTAVVVTYDSAAVIERCLDSLRDAAPRRGIDVRVVDNASTDDSARRSAARIGEAGVVRRASNGGFAAGVNEVLAGFAGEFLAVINPDLVVPRGGLDALADFMEARPKAGLVGPWVDLPDGRREATAGVFPTARREWAHAWMLDRLLGLPARRRPQPVVPERVDWMSGCAWLVRGAAIRAAGILDEGYFMYHEDADYCFRLLGAGWESWCCPDVRMIHHRGSGSTASGNVPADGGRAALRMLCTLNPQVSAASLARTLETGWRLRHFLHRAGAAMGREASVHMSRRYRLALADVEAVLRQRGVRH